MGSRFLKAKVGSHLSFLASLMGDERDKFPTEVVLIVSDFPNVFPDELLGYPHKERLISVRPEKIQIFGKRVKWSFR